MSRIRYQGSGLNSNNDTAREIASNTFSNKLRMQRKFGATSKHRQIYLEKYQWSMTWNEYKKRHGKKKV